MAKYAGWMGYELFKGSRELLSCTDKLKEHITSVNLSELTPVDVVTLLLKPSELLVSHRGRTTGNGTLVLLHNLSADLPQWFFR